MGGANASDVNLASMGDRKEAWIVILTVFIGATLILFVILVLVYEDATRVTCVKLLIIMETKKKMDPHVISQ